MASLREGRWDDQTVRAVPLTLDVLSSSVRSFGALPIYGWDFVDPPEEQWAHWQDRLSFNAVLSTDRRWGRRRR